MADVATYTALRSFLLQRVDQQLAAARVPAAIALNDELSGGEPHPPAPGGEAALPSGTYVAFIDASGTLHDRVFSYGGPEPSKPLLPEALGTEPFTTGAVAAGGPRYRVQATQVSNGVLVVGIPLTEVTPDAAPPLGRGAAGDRRGGGGDGADLLGDRSPRAAAARRDRGYGGGDRGG